MTRRRLVQLLAFALLLGALVAAGCTPGAPEGGQDAAVAPDVGATEYPTVRVATFNVRFLFDTVCDSNRCGSNDFEIQRTQEEFDAHIEQLAEAVRGLDADVVLLQEIENDTGLDALQEALDGEYPVAVLGETGWDASIDVGVLAKGELVDSRGYRDDRELRRPDGSQTRFAREFLRVDLDIEGERVIVFSAHFNSKASDDPGKRLAEAQEARAIVEETAANNEGALVVLGGDLNDTPESAPLEALTDDDGLVRVAQEKSLDETFTYVYNWQPEAIDHLLLARTDGGAYVSGTVQSVHDREPAGYGGSDHGALVAEFEMR